MDYVIIVTYMILLIMTQIKEGSQLDMLTQGQVSVMNAGESVVLDCEFYTEYFNLFDNPILWKKTQREEETQVNIMGNIVDPYVSTGRFDVTLERTHPRYRLKLEIKDLALEDSGNYTCEVRGKRSSLLGIVTHYVFVRAPVQLIYLSNANHTSTAEGARIRGLSYVEKRASTVRCVSIGGYPAPDMDVFLGSRKITAETTLSHFSSLRGSPGLRQLVYRTERWSHHFRAEAKDDGDSMSCAVQVPGLISNTTAVTLHVRFAPIIRCDPAAAYIGDKNVYLRCSVRAKPGVTVLYWAVGNGTTVAPGEVINEQWTLTVVRGDALETKLYIRVASEERFKKYTVVAENSVSTTKQDVHLMLKHKPSTRKPYVPEQSEGVQQRSSSHGRRSDSAYTYPGQTSSSATPNSLVWLIITVVLTASFYTNNEKTHLL